MAAWAAFFLAASSAAALSSATLRLAVLGGLAAAAPVDSNTTSIFVSSSYVPNQFVVVFNDEATQEQIDEHYRWLGERQQELRRLEVATTAEEVQEQATFGVQSTFKQTLRAYAGKFKDSLVFDIAARDEVNYVESDNIYTADDVQYNAPYNLARVAHRQRLTDETRSKYMYDSDPGRDVTVYVLDTGLRTSHDEFGGRARMVSFVPSASPTDVNGHGTHVAGTAVGATYGAAKSAQVVGVKVLDDRGSGATSNILRGVEYVIQQHRAGNGNSVINMSFGGFRSSALNQAARSAVEAGIHVVAAAGNSAANACYTSPAGEAVVTTVGATTITDQIAPFSNVGSCVDIFAPGVNIVSAGVTSDSATNTLSGTSMAAPLVTGLTAYLLSKNPGYSVSDIQSLLLELATDDALQGSLRGSPNTLAFNGYTEGYAVPAEADADAAALAR
ncbi:peptidase S8/S53 domain-containing protein [Dipodascopsis tothii]|uniref:peptidase S8/S53 domain-containing protein n=1 Tax=Dipodascopsis tothii TaxID=44089 RepID=UPI0034CE19E1